MAGWHHWLDAHEFGWTLGVGDGQGGLACCDSWGCKESNTTEWLNWTELNYTCYLSGFNTIKYFLLIHIKPIQARWASSIWQLHNAQHVVSRSGCQLPQWREGLRATQREFKFQAWKQLASQLPWVTWPQSNLMEGGTVSSCAHRRDSRGTSLAAQWLRLLHTSTAGGMGSIPGQGTKIIPHAALQGQKKKSICSFWNMIKPNFNYLSWVPGFGDHHNKWPVVFVC